VIGEATLQLPRTHAELIGQRVDDDPVGAVSAAARQTQDGLDDPRRADEELDGCFGRTTYKRAVDRFVSFDLVIHRWDLAGVPASTTGSPSTSAARSGAAVVAVGGLLKRGRSGRAS
jgi:hypothetical protein